jgi:hypothetical protein
MRARGEGLKGPKQIDHDAHKIYHMETPNSLTKRGNAVTSLLNEWIEDAVTIQRRIKQGSA